jgi:hypothetical protein
MKEHFRITIRKLISPSLRFELREAADWIREQLDRALLWNWEIVRLPRRADSPYEIYYIGRKAKRESAKTILRVDDEIGSNQTRAYSSSQIVVVSEIPIPGALNVPWFLSTIVSLERPIEEIIAGFGSELRKRIRKCRMRYRIQSALLDTEIDRAVQEMVNPYSIARYGASAIYTSPSYVREMAQIYGQLHLLLLGDEVVGCQAGHSFTRAGKRCWRMMMCGYPEAVFSDSKRLTETNTINHFLELEWAFNNGFDYLDLENSAGHPDGKLLQWKRRWGGLLNMKRQHTYLHVRLPKAGTARFLWDSPLFAIERGKLTLHLGLPDGLNDDEISKRYREMGFAGLFKVYLHCAKPPGEGLLETLRGFYAHQKSPPIVEIISSTYM